MMPLWLCPAVVPHNATGRVICRFDDEPEVAVLEKPKAPKPAAGPNPAIAWLEAQQPATIKLAQLQAATGANRKAAGLALKLAGYRQGYGTDSTRYWRLR